MILFSLQCMMFKLNDFSFFFCLNIKLKKYLLLTINPKMKLISFRIFNWLNILLALCLSSNLFFCYFQVNTLNLELNKKKVSLVIPKYRATFF